MLRKLLITDNSTSWFLLRVTLGTVLLAHGLQKSLGWFDGYGWEKTMQYFTGYAGLPSLLAAFVIIIETFGAIMLVAGFAARINAVLAAIVIAGAFFVDHLKNGFYMNWFGTHKGEGYEYDLLFWAIAIVIAINGAGRFSIDNWLVKKKPVYQSALV